LASTTTTPKPLGFSLDLPASGQKHPPIPDRATSMAPPRFSTLPIKGVEPGILSFRANFPSVPIGNDFIPKFYPLAIWKSTRAFGEKYALLEVGLSTNRPSIVSNYQERKVDRNPPWQIAGDEAKSKSQLGRVYTGGGKNEKIAIVLLAALFAWAVAQPAEAGHGRGGAFLLGLGLGILLVPPLIHAAPPPVVYEPHIRPLRPWSTAAMAIRLLRESGCQDTGRNAGNGYYRVWERIGFRDTGDITTPDINI